MQPPVPGARVLVSVWVHAWHDVDREAGQQPPVLVGLLHQLPDTCVSQLELQTKFHPKVRNHGEGPYKGFSWLKAATTAFTFKTHLSPNFMSTYRGVNVRLA